MIALLCKRSVVSERNMHKKRRVITFDYGRRQSFSGIKRIRIGPRRKSSAYPAAPFGQFFPAQNAKRQFRLFFCIESDKNIPSPRDVLHRPDKPRPHPPGGSASYQENTEQCAGQKDCSSHALLSCNLTWFSPHAMALQVRSAFRTLSHNVSPLIYPPKSANTLSISSLPSYFMLI